jgi:hypothetical protein
MIGSEPVEEVEHPDRPHRERVGVGRVAPAEPGKVKHVGGVVPGKDRQVAAEVSPAADTGSRAVQQQQRRPVARYVVVQLPLGGIEEPAGLVE